MSKHTPGPWRWELNLASKQVRLCGGKVKFDLNVMDFVRYGMSNAAPRFNIERRENLHLMTRADELGCIVAGREHHAEWFQGIDHPDARLIEAAPLMYEALKEVMEAIDKEYGPNPANFPKARAALQAAKGGEDV